MGHGRGGSASTGTAWWFTGPTATRPVTRMAGRVLAPVRVITDTAHSITETDLRRRIPVTGSDEIGQLARTFSAMLDRLEDALATQRAFLDDASHELRTPITSSGAISSSWARIRPSGPRQ